MNIAALPPSERDTASDEAAALIADRVEEYQASAEFAAVRSRHVGEHLINRICDLAGMGAVERSTVLGVLASGLEQLGAGTPEYTGFFDTLRADAEWWAELATQPELEAYTAAGLRQIERRPFMLAASKRILVTLWNSLGAADKQAFLKRVATEATP